MGWGRGGCGRAYLPTPPTQTYEKVRSTRGAVRFCSMKQSVTAVADCCITPFYTSAKTLSLGQSTNRFASTPCTINLCPPRAKSLWQAFCVPPASHSSRMYVEVCTSVEYLRAPHLCRWVYCVRSQRTPVVFVAIVSAVGLRHRANVCRGSRFAESQQQSAILRTRSSPVNPKYQLSPCVFSSLVRSVIVQSSPSR